MVAVERARQLIDFIQSSLWTVDETQGNRPAEHDHRRGIDLYQHRVERQHPWPVGGGPALRLAMEGGDHGLDLVTPESMEGCRALDELDGRRDRTVIPHRPVLVLEKDQPALGVQPRR